MVKEEFTIESTDGYGSRSSDDVYTYFYKTECSCSLKFKSKDNEQKKKKAHDIAEFHEIFHEITDEIESYIEKNGEQTTQSLLKRFVHVPRDMLDYSLQWITTKVDRFWIYYATRELFKNN